MNYLAPIPKQFVDQSGIPYSGGKVTVYNHGNTTKATIYVDASGNAVSPNPVVLDSNGAWKAYVPAAARYDYIVEDANGNVVFPFEDVAVPVDSDFNPGSVASEYSPEATYPAGSLVFKDGELYKALTDITTPEAWDPWHWGRTDIADCMPILFECTAPNWPDPDLMFEAVKAGRLAGICQLSYNGEYRTIFALTDTANRTVPPVSYVMEFRHVTSFGEDVVQFAKSSGSWTTSVEYNKSAPRATVCSNWSSSITYTTGNLVYRGNKLYRCLVASSSHTWTAAEWTETDIATELQNAGSSLAAGIIAGEYSSSDTYDAGMLCMKEGHLYCCISDITSPEAWNATHWEETSLGNYGPVVFRCNAPNWPDPTTMFNVCMACKEAFISRMGEGAETFAVWRLSSIFRRDSSPRIKTMTFEVTKPDRIEEVKFTEENSTWSVAETSKSIVDRDMVAPNWASADSHTYKIGTLVYHNGTLYKCKVNPASNTWVAAEWESTTVADAKAPRTIYLSGTSSSPPAGANVWAAITSNVDVVISIIGIGGHRQDLYQSNVSVAGADMDVRFASVPSNGKCYTLHYSSTDSGTTWTATYEIINVDNNIVVIEGNTNNVPPAGTSVHAAYIAGKTPIVKMQTASGTYRVYNLVYANTYGATYRRYYFASIDANNATIYSILYVSSDGGSTFTTTEYERPYTMRSTIAPDFSVVSIEDQYPVGSLIYHQNSYGANKLYRCTTANDGGTWDPAKWEETTVGKEIGEITGGEVAKNGWVDASNLIEAMPGVTAVTKVFYINEVLGLYRFQFKAYSTALTRFPIELFKINYSGFVNASGIAMTIGPNDEQLNTPIPFGVYDEFSGHDSRVVVWPNNNNEAAGATGIYGFGILK